MYDGVKIHGGGQSSGTLMRARGGATALAFRIDDIHKDHRNGAGSAAIPLCITANEPGRNVVMGH
jgi:hypothetical protein